MQQQITLLAQLAVIDAQLDELHDDLGDLPAEVKKHETAVRKAQILVDTTQSAINDVVHLQATGHITQQELTDREARLTEQQFKVKNNKEFDAITSEIEHVKLQRTTLDESLRTSSVKDENLKNTLADQTAVLEDAKSRLSAKEAELASMSGEHNEELIKLIALRKKLMSGVEPTLETEYERIRTFHREAVVPLRRNSCSGCFSAIPSQKIMEMKYNRDKIYTCESCGRILYTEDVVVEIEM